MTTRIYGYARVSTMKQSFERQIENIKKAYPEAVIIAEKYTGKRMDRPSWEKLIKQIRPGDTIVFDDVARMSRDAAEGFKAYKELYDMGVNLVFLKDSTLNTDNFKQVEQIEKVGNDIADACIETTNRVLMMLAEKQIHSAFAAAEWERVSKSKNTSEGVRRAQAAGKVVGIKKGRKLTTKKSVAKKEEIKKYSKDFDGNLNDIEVMKITGLSRNTFYKYKAEMKAEV